MFNFCEAGFVKIEWLLWSATTGKMRTIHVNHSEGSSIVRVRARSKTRISQTSKGAIVIENDDGDEGRFWDSVCIYARAVILLYTFCLLVMIATLSKAKVEHLIYKLSADFDKFRQGFA
jgi:hypothetical protein